MIESLECTYFNRGISSEWISGSTFLLGAPFLLSAPIVYKSVVAFIFFSLFETQKVVQVHGGFPKPDLSAKYVNKYFLIIVNKEPRNNFETVLVSPSPTNLVESGGISFSLLVYKDKEGHFNFKYISDY